jgi:hypothetical protein
MDDLWVDELAYIAFCIEFINWALYLACIDFCTELINLFWAHYLLAIFTLFLSFIIAIQQQLLRGVGEEPELYRIGLDVRGASE